MQEITVSELAAALQSANPPVLVDVRWPEERAIASIEPSILIPLPDLEARAQELEPYRGKTVVLFCHHGVRSMRAAAVLSSIGHQTLSLRGGIDAWSLEIDPNVARY